MRCLAALALLLFAGSALAATYAYRNDVFSYDTPSVNAKTVGWHASGASPACTNFPLGDDDWADISFASATSPANNFTFTFAGTVYNQVRIYSNGMLAFGGDNSGYWRQYGNLQLPITAASSQTYAGCSNTVPSNLIIAYWIDIVAGTGNNTTGASVQYELLGTAPNRRLVISFVNVKLYGQTTRYNFQIALYESPAGGLNSNFKFQYTTGSSTGNPGTVGVQVSTTDYTQYSYNQNFIDPTAGSAILWYPANQLAAKSAEYRFDESSWNGTPGEVKDTSGNGQNGVRLGNAMNVSNGKICRGGSFTNNTSNTVMDSVATPITPTNVGSADFWYQSTGTADAMLLDATATAARPFFFEKTAAGALKLSVTDSTGTVLSLTTSSGLSFSAWRHVGFSWNLRPGTNQTLLQIFVDGALNKSLRTTSSGALAAVSTLDIGDNATSGVTPSGGTANGANGLIDEVNIYPTEINPNQAMADKNATRTACTTLDHFHVLHNGSAVSCDTAPVVIEAHDANHALISLSGVTMTLSTSTNHGTWSNVIGGAINPITNLGNGQANYVFSNESRVTFGLQDPYLESLVISATAGAVTTSSGAAAVCTAADYTFGTTCNAPLTFVQAGFRFVDAAGNPIASQVAGVASPTYYLQAIRTDTKTGACAALFPPGTAATVSLASECNNPAACQAGQAVTFVPGAGAGATTNLPTNANGAVSSYASVPLTFNAAAPAPVPAVPFTFSYSDVGEISLWAGYTPAGLPTISGSAKFIVAPKAFAFSGVTAGPIKAGKTFGATITAVNGAGNATPNFGQESTPETVDVSFSKCQPAGVGASNGTLGGTGGTQTFSAGATTFGNLTWSEVGNIDLTAALYGGSYLGSGLTATGTTGAGGVTCNGAGNVGRFIPDHFETVVTTQGCGAFTYSGQPFTLTVTAKNGLPTPTVTTNYDGSAATSPNFAQTTTLSDTSGAAGSLSPSTVAASGFSAGVATLSTLKWIFPAPPLTNPRTVVLRAVDADNVSSKDYESGASVPVRQGRLRLSNAFGSEKSPLAMPLQAQYWSGAWVSSDNDNCTVVPTNAVFLSNYTGSLTAASFGASPVTCVAPYCDGSGNIKLVNGQGYLRLAAPAPSTGSVSLAVDLGASGVDQSCLAAHGGTPANRPWLRSQFGSCAASTTYSADPAATATFGVYAPETPKTVHIRELF